MSKAQRMFRFTSCLREVMTAVLTSGFRGGGGRGGAGGRGGGRGGGGGGGAPPPTSGGGGGGGRRNTRGDVARTPKEID
jgi:hypothetical protein